MQAIDQHQAGNHQHGQHQERDQAVAPACALAFVLVLLEVFVLFVATGHALAFSLLATDEH